MKQWILTLAVVLTLGGTLQSTSRATEPQSSTLPTTVLHAILENAHAAQENAAIYQWKRVNLEVDRIVADEHKLQRTLTSDHALAEKSEALQQAVSSLRSARLARHIDDIAKATEQISTICTDLLAK